MLRLTIKVQWSMLAWIVFLLPLDKFSLIWRHYHKRWKASNFCLYSALLTINQWGDTAKPIETWDICLCGHLWWPMILTPVAECLAVGLSLLVLATWVCHNWRSNPNLLNARQMFYQMNHHGGLVSFEILDKKSFKC